MTSQRTNPWTKEQQRQHVKGALYFVENSSGRPQSFGPDLYHEKHGYSLIGLLSDLCPHGGWTYDSKHGMWGYNNVKIILSRDVQEFYGFRTPHGCDVPKHTLTYLQEVVSFNGIVEHYIKPNPYMYFTWAEPWW